MGVQARQTLSPCKLLCYSVVLAYLCIFYLHLCLCKTCVPGAHGDQKVVVHLLGQEFAPRLTQTYAGSDALNTG